MKPVIGQFAATKTRTARTLEDAFGCGTHNRPALRRPWQINLDMIIGASCMAVVVALPWLTWKGVL